MKNKFIDFIKEQLNIDLINDKDNIFNKKRNILYCEVKKQDESKLLIFLKKQNIQYENHIGGNYWIWVNI